jgi:hypothetical protein
MEKKIQVMATFIALVVLVAGLYIFTNWFSMITGYFTGESEQETLALCLKNQGAEFYFSTYCPDCEKQEQELGQYSNSIKKVDCGRNKENCPNIRNLPAWYIPNSKDKINYGFFTLNELKTLGNCQ